MGIRKDLKKYIKELNDTTDAWLDTDCTVKRLEEILKHNQKKEKKKAEKIDYDYIAVEQSNFADNGNTFEALKDGYGLPPTGYKYVKVRE